MLSAGRPAYRCTMQYRTRPAPCAHCGDTVLIAADTPLRLFGRRIGAAAVARLEHADPGPADEVFDGVDDACTRPRVRR